MEDGAEQLKHTSAAAAEARALADERLSAGDDRGAAAALAALWRASPSQPSAAHVVRSFESLRERLPLLPCRVYMLRSFTVEPVVSLLRAAAFVARIDAEVRLGEFGSYAQEILDPSGDVYSWEPEAIVLAVDARDVDADAAELLISLVRTLAERSTAHVVVHGLEVSASGPENAESVNRELAALAQELPSVSLLDYNALVARAGRENWFDPRLWESARLPIAAPHLNALAQEWLRFLHPIAGRSCKVLAVDLDDTLWDGVIGEDGLAGIRVGEGFRAVHRALLELRARGTVLAVCSKNNPAEALEALRDHPQLLVRPGDFAALRIGWGEKWSALVELAEELNVGLDAIAFLDDSPIEREAVRQQLPDVTVLELPTDPHALAAGLTREPVFERLAVTAEDRARWAHYEGQRQRRELEHSTPTLEEFLHSLATHVRIEASRPETLPRSAQLTQKTNQFNLTTRRYSERELEQLVADGTRRLTTIRVSDRFGDSGIVGLAIVRRGGDEHEIETLLLSCRVIGRGIETALLASLAQDARADAAVRLLGRFRPTAKNAPAASFYASHGFVQVAAEPGGESSWVLELLEHDVPWPDWIKRVTADEIAAP